MKRIQILILAVLGYNLSIAQNAMEIIPGYFKEIRQATKSWQGMWDKDLYGPVLLVDPKTRNVYANYPDSLNSFKGEGDFYEGLMPNEINVANTALNWNGRRWAMIMLPLPTDRAARINLLSHELFHASQPSLGFLSFNPGNDHLNQMNGRIYLRLELAALKNALRSTDPQLQKKHLTSAFVFRKYRNELYPGSDVSENQLELNEGLAEYTGSMMSGRSHEDLTIHYLKDVDSFLTNPTFVRSFAYQTTPIYGFLLNMKKPNWNKSIKATTNLTAYFTKELGVTLPENIKQEAGRLSQDYNGNAILSEEKSREEKRLQMVAVLKKKFVDDPHLDIPFENMKISFDPRNIVPLDGHGTIYPHLRVSDNWGILSVENNALIGSNWDRVVVGSPIAINETEATGDGWKLTLNPGYAFKKDEETGNYKLLKK